MESSDVVPACAEIWVWRVLNKGAMVPVSTLSLERATLTLVPLAVTSKPVNSLPPHMFLALFRLLPLKWNPEQVSL